METDTLVARLAQRALVLGLTLSIMGCGEIPNPHYVLPNFCQMLEDAPVTPLSAPLPPDAPFTKVYESIGQIKVMHGLGTAKLAAGKNIIKVVQSVPVPSYANHATVFLNGWEVNYLGDDQHLLALGTLISKITFDRRGTLSWTAIGLLRDDDFEEGYGFTYHFTVLAWNDAALNLIVDNGTATGICNTTTNLPEKSFLALSNGAFTNGTTALSAFSAFSQNPAFPSGHPVAVLPRGFGFGWYDGDHHLLQLAYNLEHSEIFAESGKLYNNNTPNVHTLADIESGMPAPLPGTASLVDSGFVSWTTEAILKDNSSRRDYLFAEATSTLGGTDVGIIQPPFAVLPRDSGGSTSSATVMTQDFVIEAVPFEFAIPMLTGWELGYAVDDAHVKEVGIWIDHWTYVGDTLRYTIGAILRDNDANRPQYFRHKVTILGVRSTAGRVAR